MNNTLKTILSFMIFSFLLSNSSFAIKVLTYNICWECMTGTGDQGSAKALGKICKFIPGKKKTYCAENIAEEIDSIYEHYNSEIYASSGSIEPWDFVGMQEAKNIESLDSALSLQSLKKVSGSGLSTLYNPNYTLQRTLYGRITSGRPVQVLIFSNIIFINLHAPHNPKASLIEQKIGEAFKNRKNKLSQSDIDKLKNHRIIVVGDFNDHDGIFWKNQKKYNPFRPLRAIGIDTPVYLPGEPPKSCCSTKVPLNRVTLVGDYIFDSTINTDFKFKVPSLYNKNTPKSDHLPVVYVGDN